MRWRFALAAAAALLLVAGFVLGHMDSADRGRTAGHMRDTEARTDDRPSAAMPAAPRSDPATGPAGADPCAAAPWSSADSPPTADLARQHGAAIAALGIDCLKAAPPDWRWALLVGDCVDRPVGGPRGPQERTRVLAGDLPQETAVPRDLSADTLDCLLERLLDAGLPPPALVMRLLLERFRSDRLGLRTEEAGLSLARQLVRRIGTTNIAWWRDAWAHLGQEAHAQSVRLHVLVAIGAELGRNQLVEFLAAALAWEDLDTGAGAIGLGTAGIALSRFAQPDLFTPRATFGAGPRLGTAMLHAVPHSQLWPTSRGPAPFEDPAMAEAAYAALAACDGTVDCMIWRATLVDRMWTHFGPRIALDDLASDWAGGRRRKDRLQMHRLDAALQALLRMERDPTLHEHARPLQQELERILGSMSIADLQRAIHEMAPHLQGSDDAEVALRSRLTTLIGDERLSQLTDRAALRLLGR